MNFKTIPPREIELSDDMSRERLTKDELFEKYGIRACPIYPVYYAKERIGDTTTDRQRLFRAIVQLKRQQSVKRINWQNVIVWSLVTAPTIYGLISLIWYLLN